MSRTAADHTRYNARTRSGALTAIPAERVKRETGEKRRHQFTALHSCAAPATVSARGRVMADNLIAGTATVNLVHGKATRLIPQARRPA